MNDKWNKKPVELNEETRIALRPSAFYGAIAACVLGTMVAATSYLNILHRLDSLSDGQLTRESFQGWVDQFREANPSSKVPAVPKSHAFNPVAVIAATEIKTRN